jgi:hypothetical protein
LRKRHTGVCESLPKFTPCSSSCARARERLAAGREFGALAHAIAQRLLTDGKTAHQVHAMNGVFRNVISCVQPFSSGTGRLARAET